jgi:hypothetical protein
VAPKIISVKPPPKAAPHMAAGPNWEATGARVPVSVADGPWMIGRRLPIVVWMRVATPIEKRPKLMREASWSGDIPIAAATARGSTKGEMSTSVCCQP